MIGPVSELVPSFLDITVPNDLKTSLHSTLVQPVSSRNTMLFVGSIANRNSAVIESLSRFTRTPLMKVAVCTLLESKETTPER